MENMLGNTLGTWGAYLEPDGNPLGTQKEHSGLGTRENGEKILLHNPPPKT